MRLIRVVLLGLLSANFALADGDDIAPESAVKREPQLRVVPRDRDDFAAIRCENLDGVRTTSEQELQALERRRQQCLDHYKAFFPGGAVR